MPEVDPPLKPHFPPLLFLLGFFYFLFFRAVCSFHPSRSACLTFFCLFRRISLWDGKPRRLCIESDQSGEERGIAVNNNKKKNNHTHTHWTILKDVRHFHIVPHSHLWPLGVYLFICFIPLPHTAVWMLEFIFAFTRHVKEMIEFSRASPPQARRCLCRGRQKSTWPC